MYLDAERRRSDLAALRATAAQPLDVLVIGGGVTGTGIALDAAARGYRVGLIERGDFASGTSSWSTKLAHGGIRYLPQFDFGLVREALGERAKLLRNAPHLTQPLAFILPLYVGARHPVGLPVTPPFGIGMGEMLDLGLTLYDALAGRANVGAHRRISATETLERAHCLRPDGLRSGFVYYDGQTDDVRLTLALARSAAARGARVINYCEATGFVRATDDSARIVGVMARTTQPDGVAGETLTIHARHIVNATGIWVEQVERLGGGEPTLQVAPSKGTHLVFARESFDLGDEAVVLPETPDGRILFIIPWRSRALVGTTDDPWRMLDEPTATDTEISYLLEQINRYSRRPVGEDEIIATYAGYRPLLRSGVDGSEQATARLSRTHALVEGAGGLLTISGGKLTTYRRMAQDVMDAVDRRDGRPARHKTETLALVGAEGLAEARATLIGDGASGLAEDIRAHLLGSYGAEARAVCELVARDATLGRRLAPDLPYIAAELVWGCRAELALTLEDALARRTRLLIEDRAHGLDAAVGAAETLARELGWSSEEREAQLAGYRAFVGRQTAALSQRRAKKAGRDAHSAQSSVVSYEGVSS